MVKRNITLMQSIEVTIPYFLNVVLVADVGTNPRQDQPKYPMQINKTPKWHFTKLNRVDYCTSTGLSCRLYQLDFPLIQKDNPPNPKSHDRGKWKFRRHFLVCGLFQMGNRYNLLYVLALERGYKYRYQLPIRFFSNEFKMK